MSLALFLRKLSNKGTVIALFRQQRTAASIWSSHKVLNGGGKSISRKTGGPSKELNITENSSLWMRDLNAQGYAVVPNVLSLPECDNIIDKAWEWLAALGTGIERHDPSTWVNDRWPTNFNGIIQRYRIGHAPFVWQARTNSNVIGVFKEIWGTEELLTSFDAMGILRPVEMVSDMKLRPSWFHTDQSPLKDGFHCVQGVLNLEEASTEDAGFACFPGSHKLHKELFLGNDNYDTSIDFNVIYEEDLLWVKREKGLVPTRVPASKGSFIIFDSRLLHCNVPAKVPRKNPRWRYTLYICMTPRAWADKNTLQARVEAFRNQRMTTHWPHHVGLFPDDPDFPKLPQVELNDVGQKLVGLKDYDGNELDFEEGSEPESGFLPHDRPAL